MKKILLICLLIIITINIELAIFRTETCFKHMVEGLQNKKIFSFHANQTKEMVNLVLYGEGQKILNYSGVGLNYNSFIEVKYDAPGQYKFCFEKYNENVIDIHFDIIDQYQDIVGKQDINKVRKRISTFLVDIRKVGWELKQVVNNHNQIKQNIRENNKSNFRWTIFKILIMIIIFSIQAFTIRKIFV